ncbi:hypothetical protein K466DRAFT_567205 [Polyporus arcularius HHB13444]|uniref:Uncharacterized protein n=1 Tax=Polyporus arcularius HHB13444 TaxID=1314778 RepID=A0A5C3P7D7_9APHY|nr:hypothetical protein K466DRAFT_567205 [Polyporus arcularius HHB13444]
MSSIRATTVRTVLVWEEPEPPDFSDLPPLLNHGEESEPPEFWDLPPLEARGDGVVSLLGEDSEVHGVQRLSLAIRVPSTAISEDHGDAMIKVPQVAFPETRVSARTWKTGTPVEVDLFQLKLEHEEAFLDLWSILSYFGAYHAPAEEELAHIRWLEFERTLQAIINDGEEAEDMRIMAVARWGRENLPNDVFDHPWWQGRWDWFAPSPPNIASQDEDAHLDIDGEQGDLCKSKARREAGRGVEAREPVEGLVNFHSSGNADSTATSLHGLVLLDRTHGGNSLESSKPHGLAARCPHYNNNLDANIAASHSPRRARCLGTRRNSA